MTDDEQRILSDAIQCAELEGGSLLMPFCRNRADSQGKTKETVPVTEAHSDEMENATGVPSVTVSNSEQAAGSNVEITGERDIETDTRKDALRGKPNVTNVETLTKKIYVNKNAILKINKENLASENTDKNYAAAIQEQLLNISVRMNEFKLQMNELVNDGKKKDERLNKMEQSLRATDTKVCEPNKNSTIDNNNFDRRYFLNSTAIIPESNNLSQNDISRIVQMEIKKLNLETSKNDSISTEVSRDLRNTVRSELSTKDLNMRRDYKLTLKTKYEHFIDFLKSELRTLDLIYVMDPSMKATVDLDERIKDKHKFKDRDIIITKIDQIYHAKVVEIQDPLELLKRIREIKINEVNETSMTLRRQLYSMQYNPLKAKDETFN